jgi:SAM-dependent methyltransferase
VLCPQPALMAEETRKEQQPLEVLEDVQVDSREPSDADSSLGDADRSTISSSINSSVTDFRHEHGRRYHAFEESQYWLPNDDTEIERLDIQHHCWQLSLGGALYLSPIPKDTHAVIDIGTGTGRWAVEFADNNPSAEVIGTDLSPIQPAWTPPNCSWLVDNAEEEWVYSKKFDFIHSRMLLMGIHDWPRYFRQAWDNLKPGGWIEVQEVQFPIGYADDGRVTKDSPLLVWSKHVQEAAGKDGIDTMCTEKFREHLEKQGFINIREQRVRWAVGAWPKGTREKTLGKWTLENTRSFISPIALALFTKRLGWTTEAVEKFLVDVKADLEDKKTHYFWQLYVSPLTIQIICEYSLTYASQPATSILHKSQRPPSRTLKEMRSSFNIAMPCVFCVYTLK